MKRKLTITLSLITILLLVGCSKKTSNTEPEPTTKTVQTQEQPNYFVEPVEYTSFIAALPDAPDFSVNANEALEAYKAAPTKLLQSGRLDFPDSNSYLLVDNSGIRVVNPSERSSKLVDYKFFKNENGKLVIIGVKSIDNCRVPVAITLMEDGIILTEEVFEDIESIDTINLDEETNTIILKARYMSLVENGTTLKFYRFGEELTGGFEMPELSSGNYSSVFVDTEGILYLTLVSTNLENPWIQLVKVDEGVKAVTPKVFDKKANYAFPIYTKEVDGEDVEFTALMDMETYKSYVYMIYPEASDLNLEPKTTFEVIKPEDYVSEKITATVEATENTETEAETEVKTEAEETSEKNQEEPISIPDIPLV